MRSGTKVVVATVVLLGSVVWGFTVLRADVSAPITPNNLMQCGSVGMVAIDRQIEVSGEIDVDLKPFEQACVAKARGAARAATAPLLLAIGSTAFLLVSFVGVVRRAKSEGRSTGPLAGHG